jgi:hypothetical protein
MSAVYFIPGKYNVSYGIHIVRSALQTEQNEISTISPSTEIPITLETGLKKKNLNIFYLFIFNTDILLVHFSSSN